VFGPAGLSRVVASTSVNFDVSVFEIFCPLLVGGCVELVGDMAALVAGPAGRVGGVSLVSGVPSAFSQLLAGGSAPVAAENVVLAGEALSARVVQQVRAVLPGARIANLYGPPEAAAYATAWFADGVDAGRSGSPPIGRPVR